MTEYPHCPECQRIQCKHLPFCAKCDIQRVEPHVLNVDGVCGACILDGRADRWSISSLNYVRITKLAHRFPQDSDLPLVLNNIIQQKLSAAQEDELEHVSGRVRFSYDYLQQPCYDDQSRYYLNIFLTERNHIQQFNEYQRLQKIIQDLKFRILAHELKSAGKIEAKQVGALTQALTLGQNSDQD